MRDGEEYTKQQIALQTGLSVSTCNTLLNEMEDDREVVSEKKKLQEVGRTSAVFRMNEVEESGDDGKEKIPKQKFCGGRESMQSDKSCHR